MEPGALRTGDPERLGAYTLTGRIGEGGQGAVFLGGTDDGRQVAIKLLHAELTADDRARARFLRELEVAKRVAGFCTAQVLDADVAGDRPYIVSEYVPGPSLARRVTGQGPLSGAVLERLAIGTITALVAIHQAGIVHRDFKPHNVLIGPDGPRVIDFGVARAISGASTVTSRAIGTPAYMAPEQLLGDDVGTAADVFCWAATIVFAATGRPPFGQDTIPAVINRILHSDPDLGGMTGPLADLVAESLAKDPASRPGASAILMRLLGHGAAPAPAPADDATSVLAEASEIAADLDDDSAHNARRTTADIPPYSGDRPAAPVDATTVDGPAVPQQEARTSHLPQIGDPQPESTWPGPGDRDTGPAPMLGPREWAEENGLNPVATHAPTSHRGGVPARPLVLAGAAGVLLVALASVAFALSGGDDETGRRTGVPSQGGTTQQVSLPPESARPGELDDDEDETEPAPSTSTSSAPRPSPTEQPDVPDPTPSGSAGEPSGSPSDSPGETPSEPPPSSGAPDPEPSGSLPESG